MYMRRTIEETPALREGEGGSAGGAATASL
jgi:hypothetical protein